VFQDVASVLSSPPGALYSLITQNQVYHTEKLYLKVKLSGENLLQDRKTCLSKTMCVRIRGGEPRRLNAAYVNVWPASKISLHQL